jgi:hypothetical protein
MHGMITPPNHALQRTRLSRQSSQQDPDAVYRDCNPRLPRALPVRKDSLSLGR